MPIDRRQFNEYLLGKLTDESAETLDLQIIAGEISREEIETAEDFLIEDFLEGALTNEEINLFNTNFLVTEDRRARLAEITRLKKYAREFMPEKSSETVTPNSFFERLKNLTSIFRSPLRTVAAIALLILITAGIWFIFSPKNDPELVRLEKKYAELNARDLSDPAGFESLTTKSLFPSTLRSGTAEKPLSAEKSTEDVLFRLALPFEPDRAAPFKAVVVRDEKTVFRQSDLRSYGKEMRLILPKSILLKGRFQIRLENSQTADSPIVYNFSVE